MRYDGADGAGEGGRTGEAIAEATCVSGSVPADGGVPAVLLSALGVLSVADVLAAAVAEASLAAPAVLVAAAPVAGAAVAGVAAAGVAAGVEEPSPAGVLESSMESVGWGRESPARGEKGRDRRREAALRRPAVARRGAAVGGGRTLRGVSFVSAARAAGRSGGRGRLD